MLTKKEDLIFAIAIIAVVVFILAGFVLLFVYNYFKSRANKEKEIQKAIYRAQEEERTEIAEELHNDILGNLTALKLQNELIRRERAPDKIIDYVNENAAFINSIAENVRSIVRDQASQYIVNNGIHHELEQLKNQYASVHGVKIYLQFNSDKVEFTKDFEINLFRILQELIHNSVKHAACTEIKIEMHSTPGELKVIYSDNGKGFQKPENNSMEGMGLRNIDTRIKLFDGKYDFISVPEKETSYTIHFKLKNRLN